MGYLGNSRRIRHFSSVFLILAACALPAGAVTPEVVWTGTFGGVNEDSGYAVATTADGGYVLAGTTDPTGAGISDVYLVKIDADGTRQWERTYGGAAVETARGVVQTADGGYMLAGIIGVPPLALDVLVIRTDASGEILWQTTMGGPYKEDIRGMCSTFDGGVVVCGERYGSSTGPVQFYLAKVDADGQVVWERSYGQGRGYGVRETADHGLVFCGYSSNSELVPENSARLFRVNVGGGLVWQRTYIDNVARDDKGFDLVVRSDGDIAMAGTNTSYLTLRRVSATGALRWSEDYLTIRAYNAVIVNSPRGGVFSSFFTNSLREHKSKVVFSTMHWIPGPIRRCDSSRSGSVQPRRGRVDRE